MISSKKLVHGIPTLLVTLFHQLMSWLVITSLLIIPFHDCKYAFKMIKVNINLIQNVFLYSKCCVNQFVLVSIKLQNDEIDFYQKSLLSPTELRRLTCKYIQLVMESILQLIISSPPNFFPFNPILLKFTNKFQIH
jgi:hypothetical protein